MGYFAGIRKLKMPPKNVQATIKLVKRCLTFFTKHALVQPEEEIHRLLQNNEGNYLFIDMGGGIEFSQSFLKMWSGNRKLKFLNQRAEKEKR